MSAVAQLWAAVKNGLLLVLATRNEAKISSSGEFVSYFVWIFTGVLFLLAAQRGLFAELDPSFAQFETLRQVGMTLASCATIYLIYVLAAGVEDWFQKTYMNGPYVIELALAVVLIIVLLTVLGSKFTQYSSAKPRHVDHLLAIGEQFVKMNRQ